MTCSASSRMECCHCALFSPSQSLGKQQIRCRDVLPDAGEVLAEPGLVVAELVRQHEHLEVFVQQVRVGSVGRMSRHGKHTEFDAGTIEQWTHSLRRPPMICSPDKHA